MYFDPSFIASYGLLGDELIYSAAEVAAILEVDVGHVYDLIKAGRLRASNIGTARRPVWRIKHSAVMAMLDEPPQRLQVSAPVVADPLPVPRKRGRPKKAVDILRTEAHGLNRAGGFAARLDAYLNGEK